MRSSKSALIALIWALLIGCGFSVSSAWAGYVVTLQQVGPNVVATGSGALDLTGLTFFDTESFTSEMQPFAAIIYTGPAYPNFAMGDVYVGNINGPGNFGSGGNTITANNASGDIVGIFGLFPDIVVPQGYISRVLSDSATYDNQTFSSLGVTPGTYEWTWGNGPNQNFTLIAVPEPRVGLLLGAGFLLLVGVRLRQLRLGSGAA
jgi:hypothetical protein